MTPADRGQPDNQASPLLPAVSPIARSRYAHPRTAAAIEMATRVLVVSCAVTAATAARD
ncbi:MAG TPA: hypothetical protein VFN75_01545 [Pseudonocardiaceae bacterium]|nr:hypothetical protein [Pseudonocardiaceae bacterium]